MNRTDRIGLQVFIGLACDADYQMLSDGAGNSANLTIAQALEVMK